MALTVGDPLPRGDDFGVSVYLPKWKDTLAWAERDPEFLARLKTGYPRFFIPRAVLELSRRVLKKATPGPGLFALLLSSYEAAEACHAYLQKFGNFNGKVLHVKYSSDIEIAHQRHSKCHDHSADIYAVTYTEHVAGEAKAFWQHTGSGISGRCAVYWLEHGPLQRGLTSSSITPPVLPFEDADRAVQILRKRIARDLSTSSIDIQTGDVFLYPTGMSAIKNTVLGIQKLSDHEQKPNRVAVFGFLYVDTFKVLSKIQGIECVLYGHASPEDLDALEADLNGGMIIHALYTEFPGNPLMTSPDLESLRQLSLKYDFPLVIDDTIATSINVALFPYCDVICTSLTKMFSGGCNVMGGSAVLNPHSPWYVRMRRTISTQPSEPYFPLDVLIMEQNSKDFRQRIMQANTNAEMIVDLLKCHTSVAQVFYPKGSPSQRLYDRFRRSGGGYGFLVSIRFVTAATAIAFYDALDVAKGPSLGTNFTLCCAYTLLAHYRELEWAAKFGVTEHLIRISVGIERPEVLEELVAKALAAAAETLTVGRDDSEMDISE